MPDATLSRRPSPILLIIPILLTVAGLALSVLLYLKHFDKKDGTKVKREAAEAELAQKQADLDRAKARLYGKTGDPTTPGLLSLLGYAADDYQAWLETQNAGSADFVRAIDALAAEEQKAAGEVATINTQINTLTTDIASVQAAKAQAVKAKEAEHAQRLKDLENVDRAFKPRTDDLQARIIDAGKTEADKRRESQTAQDERKVKKDRQDRLLAELQRQIDVLEEFIETQVGRSATIDGRVVAVPPGTASVTVDIGWRQRLRPGMVFQVIDRGQVIPDPKDPNGPPIVAEKPKRKSDIEITHVYETQARGAILKLDFSNPIMPGDGILNAAYDPRRVTRIVAIGQIDLTGDGEPDPELLERVVKEIGAQLDPEVGVTTDFVLAGKDWSVDDPALRPRFRRDQEQVKAAEALVVPFLSVRRFLEYVGVRVTPGGKIERLEMAGTSATGAPAAGAGIARGGTP